MTKQEFDEYFKKEVLRAIAKQYEQDGIPDRPARREAYNNEVDALIKDGQLPVKAENWGISDSLETTRYWL